MLSCLVKLFLGTLINIFPQEEGMKKYFGWMILGMLVAGLLLLGFFAGYNQAVNKCTPDMTDFYYVEAFMGLVDEELREHSESGWSYGYDIEATFSGPVLRISVHNIIGAKERFEQVVNIHKDLIEKAKHDDCGRMDIEQFRPLAEEIAKKIIQAQPKRNK